MMKTRLTSEQIEEAKRLQSEGLTYMQIGAAIGSNYPAVRRVLDHEFAERCRARERARFRETSAHASKFVTESCRIPASDTAARLAEIPPDTRNLTQRIFGDPLPGRSALDRRQQL